MTCVLSEVPTLRHRQLYVDPRGLTRDGDGVSRPAVGNVWWGRCRLVSSEQRGGVVPREGEVVSERIRDHSGYGKDRVLSLSMWGNHERHEDVSSVLKHTGTDWSWSY